jgi:hypothetical protein
MFIRGFRALDRVLRGDATRLPELKGGSPDIPAFSLSNVLILLGIIAGACTGVFAVITRYNFTPPDPRGGWMQLLATSIKVPLLFCLTLVVTFPSLYVFNALVGSRLSIIGMLKLLVAAMAVMMAVVSSLGPIVAFFAVSTTSYPFMKLLNVIAYAVAGMLGLSFLLQTLHRLSAAQIEQESMPTEVDTPVGEAAPSSYPAPPGAIERMPFKRHDPRVTTIFRIWIIVFGLVGAQMSWVLRPFIGNPDQPFSFFRKRESNFFAAVIEAIKNLFSW